MVLVRVLEAKTVGRLPNSVSEIRRTGSRGADRVGALAPFAGGLPGNAPGFGDGTSDALLGPRHHPDDAPF
jgi:hypothetical protein